MIDSSPATYSGNCAGRTAASSINATGLAGPGRPVRSERPALRIAQTRFISASFAQIKVRSPSFRAESVASRSGTSSSKNSTSKNRFARLGLELEQLARRPESCSCPLVCSKSGRSMCSIAAGCRSSSSTVACIASATEAKKIKPSPFARGNGTICSSAEKIAANVPSLPDKISVRLSGARAKRSTRVAAPSLQHSRRHPFRDFGGLRADELRDLLLLGCECSHDPRRLFRCGRPPARFPAREYGPQSCRRPGRARPKNCWRSFRLTWRASWSRRRDRNKIRAACRKALS